jgi:hypothetical protein
MNENDFSKTTHIAEHLENLQMKIAESFYENNPEA